MIGQTLSHFKITAKLGEGGMGEVYRAEDTKLGREVAIKVLPSTVAENSEFRARFDREAKVISSLNHPNICTLYEVGQEGSTHFLVMELIEGESLGDRLESGPLALDQVLRYGAQVAEALDQAHKQGIIHRDLKPGNIMLTKSGAKLLDFGLARSGVESAPIQGLTQMHTEAQPLTAEGTILGTFQYMAPEQLEGLEADARTDIFALGALLYEMATGRRAFEGSSRTSLIAAIVSSQPQPISSVTPMTPPALDHVVRRCLEKEPDDRWQSAHDVASELRWTAEAGSQVGVPAVVATRRKSRERLAWVAAASSAAAALIAGALLLRDTAPEQQVLRAEISPAADTVFSLSPSAPGPVTVSPDGRHLAWAAVGRDGNTTLWLRSLDETVSREVEGSEDAKYPFWSPDSRAVGYFAEGKLKKVDVRGGPSITITDASNPKGGTWSEEGVILFAPEHNSPIFRVSAEGGQAEPVTTLDETRDENSHRHPRFLPDGRHFMHFTRVGAMGTAIEGSGVWVGSLDGDEPRRLTGASSQAEFASGYLLYAHGSALLAQRFDPDRLELSGDPVTLVQGVVVMSGAAIAAYSVSHQGLLAYQVGGGDLTTQLAWFSRNGARLETLGEPAFHGGPMLSPDQKRAAVAIGDNETGAGDIWIYDLDRGVRSRFTFDPSEDVTPIWSRDGRRVFWASSRVTDFDLFTKDVEGTGADQGLLVADVVQIPMSASPDGRYLAYATGVGRGVTSTDLFVLPLEEGEEPIELATSEFNEWGAQFSPDGRWISYHSDESGRFEVYITPFPGPGRKWQVSADGGTQSRWKGDGQELYYLTPTAKLMVAEVDTSGSRIKIGKVSELFETPRLAAGGFDYDVTSDGERFLMNTVGESAFEPITLVVNWTAELERIFAGASSP